MSDRVRQPKAVDDVLCVADLPRGQLSRVALGYGLQLHRVANDDGIPGSFWGEPEAGIVGSCVYVRGDTPVHSFLHELCHVICMTAERRAGLDRDAGGDDAEECAVCYLQLVLANELDGLGRERLFSDMDAWGYSFRLGSAQRWFADDAADTRAWLLERELLNPDGSTTWRLRGAA